MYILINLICVYHLQTLNWTNFIVNKDYQSIFPSATLASDSYKQVQMIPAHSYLAWNNIFSILVETLIQQWCNDAENCLNYFYKTKNFVMVSHTKIADIQFQSQHAYYAFLHIFTIGGATWTLDPNIEAANFKIKLGSNKFISVAV